MLFACGLAIGCARLPDVQGKGIEFLQGIWVQDSVVNAGKLLSYTKYKFKFTCDSFYVDLVTHSKVNYYEESCFNNGIWKEYAKGTYKVNNDTLLLLGTYTKPNYKQKISGCYTIGEFIKSFRILSKDKEMLVLESTENQSEIRLKLKQKIRCVPQPL
jgi:hypothetical protein